jgi:hypothetical protein
MSRAIGANGADVFTSTGDPRVDLNVKLVRGADPAELCAALDAVVAAGHLTDAILLTFHSRNIRGGKGERDIGATLLNHLWCTQEAAVRKVLHLWPEYGSWRDVFAFLKGGDATATVSPSLQLAFRGLAVDQLRRDFTTPESGRISLCAKWAPREHGSRADRDVVRFLSHELFPRAANPGARLAAYRKLVASLNNRVNTVETLMCAGHWSDIRPAAVPGRAGALYGRAFLNLPVKSRSHSEFRYPDNPDRMACREHFKHHFAEAAAGRAKINGASTVFPHEIVKKAYTAGDLATEEKDQLNALWRATVAATPKMGNLVVMSDFSGSMRSSGATRDTPYWVSMALGILGAQAQAADSPFRNRLMTFDSTPRWHTFPADGDLFACLNSIHDSGIGVGLSTNFEAAVNLILTTLRENAVPPGGEPESLLVLTDMGWDQASSATEGEWATHVDRLRSAFAEGRWKMPQIVIWNLASQYSSDHHATARAPGVALLSGWSPAQFEILQTEGIRQMTPLEVLRAELDHTRYDPVRAAFAT